LRRGNGAQRTDLSQGDTSGHGMGFTGVEAGHRAANPRTPISDRAWIYFAQNPNG